MDLTLQVASLAPLASNTPEALRKYLEDLSTLCVITIILVPYLLLILSQLYDRHRYVPARPPTIFFDRWRILCSLQKHQRATWCRSYPYRHRLLWLYCSHGECARFRKQPAKLFHTGTFLDLYRDCYAEIPQVTNNSVGDKEDWERFVRLCRVLAAQTYVRPKQAQVAVP